ncbi:MAG: hypothetical protein LUD72_11665 [Bacteroidales bacterium]|nr:hypothetical protein [Bacteroidales bacterium]
MEYFGKIRTGAVRNGTKKDGTPWEAHQVEVRPVNGDGRKGMVMDVYGAERWENLRRGGLEDDAVGTLHFDVSIEERDGRKYNSFFVISFKPYVPKGEKTGTPGNEGDDSDLPF